MTLSYDTSRWAKTNQKCHHCDGSGLVSDSPYWQDGLTECLYCDDGFLLALKKKFNDSDYNPADMWLEDFTVENVPEKCEECQGEGAIIRVNPYNTERSYRLWCDDCDGTGLYPPMHEPELDEIAYELMGVEL